MVVKEKQDGKMSEAKSQRSKKVSSAVRETAEEKPAEKAEKVIRRGHREILKQYYNY